MSDLAEAARVIAQTDELALACHVGPDGDALGSMLAFGIAAREAGKGVVASFGTPFTVPASLSFLPTDLLVPPEEFPEEPETMVVFDAGSADRLAELGSNAGKAGSLVVLDHHVTNEGFGDVAVIDGTAAATGEIVYDLLEALGWEVGPEVARCLHTALVTDTGRFTYSNTSPKTLRIASSLVEAGAQPAEIGRHVYEQAPFGYLKAAGAALRRLELDEQRGVVSTLITHEDLAEAGIDWGDIDGLIDLIRMAEEADVALLAKAHADGRVKLSLRSRGDTDVGALAAAKGGGGHRLAAGITLEGDPRGLIEEIRGLVEGYR